MDIVLFVFRELMPLYVSVNIMIDICDGIEFIFCFNRGTLQIYYVSIIIVVKTRVWSFNNAGSFQMRPNSSVKVLKSRHRGAEIPTMQKQVKLSFYTSCVYFIRIGFYLLIFFVIYNVTYCSNKITLQFCKNCYIDHVEFRLNKINSGISY